VVVCSSRLHLRERAYLKPVFCGDFCLHFTLGLFKMGLSLGFHKPYSNWHSDYISIHLVGDLPRCRRVSTLRLSPSHNATDALPQDDAQLGFRRSVCLSEGLFHVIPRSPWDNPTRDVAEQNGST
jgi:hypothetical protein